MQPLSLPNAIKLEHNNTCIVENDAHDHEALWWFSDVHPRATAGDCRTIVSQCLESHQTPRSSPRMHLTRTSSCRLPHMKYCYTSCWGHQTSAQAGTESGLILTKRWSTNTCCVAHGFAIRRSVYCDDFYPASYPSKGEDRTCTNGNNTQIPTSTCTNAYERRQNENQNFNT